MEFQMCSKLMINPLPSLSPSQGDKPCSNVQNTKDTFQHYHQTPRTHYHSARNWAQYGTASDGTDME